MHERSPYAKSPPDFAQLAKDYPALAKHVIPNSSRSSTIDFQDADAVRTLAEALLWTDFKIAASFADDRLCPTIPNRLNYVLWLQDVLSETRRILAQVKPLGPADPPGSVGEDERPRKKARLGPIQKAKLRGLDIGTGASAIYPLLFCATDSDVEMIGTDIDPKSLEHAQSIIDDPRNERHRLSSRIKTMLKRLSDPFFRNLPSSDTNQGTGRLAFDFTMCNPPFYSSKQDMLDSAKGKAKGASAVCTGTDGEMVFKVENSQGAGGEVGFVKRMMDESFGLEHRSQVLWFTSMLGRLSSVDTLLDHLQQKDRENGKGDRLVSWVVHELIQGTTKRWVLGWSFAGVHLVDEPLAVPRHRRPWTTKRNWLSGAEDIDATLQNVEVVLRSIGDLSYELRQDEITPATVTVQVAVMSVSWTRAARRAKMLPEGRGSPRPTTGAAVLCVDILIDGGSRPTLSGANASKDGKQVPQIDFCWTFGRSQATFDSFCLHVKSKWGARRIQ
ncbi:hypothetical protein OC846_000308 [Tilletia horrida]|uniref:U6 small nuclear RNA (adenine-(43)-N(6))-methyltransferase n=1 Tax=Tilletia horrida TaxID=155126 RepID=A0AAN6GY73_9BASI|nr:hypothetical protein OC846_000308 [Tilletia horrida]KAK0570285.1 hypothetical protein OC861_000028 [Tilletia horrida]